MNSERKAFEEFFFKTNAYKRIQHHIDMCASGYHQELHDVFQMDDFNENDYANEAVQVSWEAWQASTQRQGYKLVPENEINIMDMIYGKCPCGSSRSPIISDKEGYSLIHCFSCGANKYIHEDY